MTSVSAQKTAMAVAVLELFPPLICESLLNERSFRDAYGLKLEATITFGESGVSVRQSELFSAVRTVLATQSPVALIDAEGRTWNLTMDSRERELPNLVLLAGQQRLVIPDFSILSGDTSTRLRSLQESASDVNLPTTAQEQWRSILEERALEDDEFDTLQRDLRDTPVHVERTIRAQIEAGSSCISSLVPNSRRYFERLIGAYDGSGSIQAYAHGSCREVLMQLTQWRPYEGFLFSLLLSSHSVLTAEIKVDHIDREELEKAFAWLVEHGDILSCLGAVEVGLRTLPNQPEVEPFLLRLIHRIRDDDVEGNNSEFQLFSALFILVDGELARTRLLVGEPPFYRRLASLAQAALIHRQIVQFRIDYDKFYQWAIDSRGEHFYMQSLADMRSEPRWSPDMAAASQLQAEFFGRIIITGNKFQLNLDDGELLSTLLGDGAQSLRKRSVFPRPYFPGPLEGSEENPNTLPDDLARIIQKRLAGQEVEATSFIALVNSAKIFRVTASFADLAAKALRLANHSLANLEDKSQLLAILDGLAIVAAVSRSTVLADELRKLERRYRCDSQYGFSAEEAMKIALVASAARENLMEWRRFAGDWLTELAFGDLEESEGESLHSHLSVLLHLVPELWVSCARGDAALQAWCCR